MKTLQIEPLERRIAPATLAYALGLGGTLGDSVQDLGVDASGNTYLAGKFRGTVDFDPGSLVTIRVAAAGTEIGFVAKYTSAGALAWVDTLTPDTGLLNHLNLAVTASGEVFVGGDFTSTVAPGNGLTLRNPDGGIVSLSFPQANPLSNLFVAKIASDGRFLWNQSVDPANPVAVEESDLATDGAGGIYVTGKFRSVGGASSVDFGATTLSTTRAGDDYLYVTKLQDLGNTAAFIWANQTTSAALTPPAIDHIYLAVEASGLAGVAGKFTSALTFSDPATTTVTDTGDGIFFGRLAVNGAWTAVGQFGLVGQPGVGRDVSGVGMDSASHLFIAGEFGSLTDFDPGPGNFPTYDSGTEGDGFVARLAPNGTLDYAVNYFRPTQAATRSTALTVDGTGSAYVSFDGDHSIVRKYDSVGNGDDLLDLPGVTGTTGLTSLAVDAAGGLHVAGAFTTSIETAPGLGKTTLKSKGGSDVFLGHYFPGVLVGQELPTPFATQAFTLGSTGEESGRQILTDAVGNIYVAGLFNGTVDFDPGAGVVNRTSTAGADDNIFLAKYTPAGALTWVNAVEMGFRRAGGNQPNVFFSLDDLGNGYLAGDYHLQATLGAFTLVNSDPAAGGFDLRDVFVAKLDPAGTFLWADNIGGAGSGEFVSSLAVRGSTGEVIVSGSFASTVDFDPGAGTVNVSPVPTGTVGRDPFILSLNTAGGFQWVRQLGGANAFAGVNDVALASNGDVVATGFINNVVDFNLGGAASTLDGGGFGDAFVARFGAANGVAVWKQKFGAAQFDEGSAVAVGSGDSIFAAGFYSGSVDFDPGAGIKQLVEAGRAFNFGAFRDAYLLKLAGDGSFQNAVGYGSPDEDRASSLLIDATGGVFVSGKAGANADFDPGPGLALLPAPTPYLSHFDNNLGFLSARPLHDDHWHVDALGNVFVTGDFTGTQDLDPSTTKRSFTSKGPKDLYVLKLAAEGDFDAAHPVTFQDLDGDLVSLTITGPGTAHYALNGGAQHMADLDQLTLAGTGLTTTVNVGVTKFGLGSGASTAKKILTTDLQQHLGSLTLGSAFLLGDGLVDTILDLHVSGKLTKLVLGDLAANTIIRLGDGLPYNVTTDTTTPDTYNHHPDVTIGRIAGDGVQLVVLGADAPLTGPNAGIGTAGDATHPGGGGLGKVIIGAWEFAGFIRTTQSVGDFTVLHASPLLDSVCRVVLEVDKYERGSSTTANCGTMTIQNGAWGSSGSEIEGDIKAFDAEAFLLGADLTAGNIGKVIVNGDFQGTITLTDPDTLPNFTVNTDFTGTVISAGHLKKLKIKGDFIGSLQALSIGSITAYAFLGAHDGGGAPTTFIHATAGPLGTITSTAGPIEDFAISTPFAFKGFKVALANLTQDTIGLDNVHITAASIGNISVSLKSAPAGTGVDLIGIRDSSFVTTASGTTRATAGSIGNISVTLTGASGGSAAYGIVNSTFDALVGSPGAYTSTVNALGNINVKLSGQGGTNLGLSDASFFANNLGTTAVNVTHAASGGSTAQGVEAVEFTATGAIGAIGVNGNATQAQVNDLSVWAGGKVGAVTVKATTPANGTLQNSSILAGQSLLLTGATAPELLAALSRATLGAVNVSGSLLNTDLVAGGSIGAVTAGGSVSDSLILAGARLGADRLLGGSGGDSDLFQRAASIAAISVRGAFATTSIVAGVNPFSNGFGDGDDAEAGGAGILPNRSFIGPITLATASTTSNLGSHAYAIQAAGINSVKIGASAAVKVTADLYLDGVDPNDIIVRLR